MWNSKGLFVFTEYIILVSILGIHLKKWGKFKLHIDEPPYWRSAIHHEDYRQSSLMPQFISVTSLTTSLLLLEIAYIEFLYGIECIIFNFQELLFMIEVQKQSQANQINKT